MPSMVRVSLCFLLATSGLHSAVASDQLICCGWNEVFILRIEKDGTLSSKPVWSWKAEDSSEIPESARKTFANTDECKPIGRDFILITSSSGGVALVSRKDKRCHFYTQARNAHSACLLPGYRVAVASSFGGDELLVYNVEKPGSGPSKPTTKIPLKGAHGAVWDKKRTRLWALGSDELLLIEVLGANKNTTLAIEKRIKLPTPGGHDLCQSLEESIMFVTTNKHAYRFDKTTGMFSPDPTLADQPKVKSISQHPKTGEVVYHQGSQENWWSDTVRFIGKRESIRLPDRRLYKVRWDVPHEQPD